jgi:hypothetical protein
MSFDLGGMLQKYLGDAAASSGTAEDDQHDVAQNAPRDVVADGVSEAFRSDRTPHFGEMIAQSFGNADSQHRATILNQLISSIGPAALAALASNGALSGLLGKLRGGSSVTPDQASQVTPGDVRDIAKHAEQHDPGLMDRMSGFYAEHPGLVKTLGSAAAAIALAKIAGNMKK